MNQPPVCTAADAIYRLAAGNLKYLNAENGNGDISRRVRLATWAKGQSPYAIIVTCSDSRVIPESIFSAGIGELFVIRLAGNVIDDHQLGSIEYAAGHLGCRLVVVLGHTHCGAVDAAIHYEPEGYIKYITDEIKKAIGDEKDPYKASCMNVRHSVQEIEKSLCIHHIEEETGLRAGAAGERLCGGKRPVGGAERYRRRPDGKPAGTGPAGTHRDWRGAGQGSNRAETAKLNFLQRTGKESGERICFFAVPGV